MDNYFTWIYRVLITNCHNFIIQVNNHVLFWMHFANLNDDFYFIVDFKLILLIFFSYYKNFFTFYHDIDHLTNNLKFL